MPVRHVVLFQFKQELSVSALEDIHSKFNALQAIPVSMTNFGFGKTFTIRSKGYTHMLSMDFPSKEALETYSKHPAHVAFVETVVKPNVGELGILAMDIDI